MPQSGPRQCSRCSSVVYCSDACQRVGWKERHRSECLHARADHIGKNALSASHKTLTLTGLSTAQREAGTWYSHRSRAFHVRCIERYYEEHLLEFDALESACLSQSSTYRVNHWVPRFGPDGDLVNVCPIKDVPTLEWLSRSDTAYPQTYLEERLKSLGDAYGSGLLPGDMRLTDSFSVHGTASEISPLVLLKKTANGVKAVYSIPRMR